MPHTYVYRYARHMEGMVKINQRPTAELQFRRRRTQNPNAPTVRNPAPFKTRKDELPRVSLAEGRKFLVNRLSLRAGDLSQTC
jgi:hypothetical protein